MTSVENLPLIVGISGTFASGKDTLAHHLVKDFNYNHVSTGNLVREVAKKERGSTERPILREVADYYRHKDGAGVFVKMALELKKPLVITGLRSLGEAREVKKSGGVILFVDAPLEVRYKRMISRKRDNETKLTLKEFKDREEKEMYSGPSEADFNLLGIKEMADGVIDNGGTARQYVELAYELLEKVK